MIDAIIFFAILGGLIGLIPLMRWVDRRNKASIAQQMATALGIAEGQPLVVERYGRTFSATYLPGGKSQPPSVQVTTAPDTAECSMPPRAWLETRPVIVFRRETGLDTWGKRLNLCREFHTGDSQFDSKVYIESAMPEADLRGLLASVTLRQAVLDLLDAGIVRIVLDACGLYTECNIRSGRIADADVGRTTYLLSKVASELPLFRADKFETTKLRARRLALYAAQGIGFVALVTAFILTREIPAPIDSTPKMWLTAGCGFLLWLVFMTAVIKAPGGASTSMRTIASWGIPALVLFCWGTYQGACWFNYAYAESALTAHASSVVAVWDSTYKGNTYHHVDVVSWRPHYGTLSVDIKASAAARARPGTPVILSTRTGALGWEWIEGIELSNSK